MSFRMYLIVCAIFLAFGILLSRMSAAAPARDFGPHVAPATEQVPVLSDDSIPSCRQALHDIHEKHDLAGDKLISITDVQGGGVEITYVTKLGGLLLRYLLVLDVRAVRVSQPATSHCDIESQSGLKMRASVYLWQAAPGEPK